MTTMAADPIFVDTNILVYSTITLSPFHSAALIQLNDLAAAGHPLWISRQILREYLATLSRPGVVTTPIPMPHLISDVHSFESRFHIAEDGAGVTVHLLQLLGTIACAGRQVHDANIVATLLTFSISKLLTHNVADFKRFAAHITTIPLIP